MNIQRNLKFIVFFIVILSILFGTTIYISLSNYQSVLHKRDTATTLILLIFQRRFLGDDYLAYGEKRAEQQWFAKQAEIEKLIAQSKQDSITPREREAWQNVTDGAQGSRQVFQDIIAYNTSTGIGSSSALVQEQKTRLATQLSIKSQETVSAASILEQIHNRSLNEVLNQIVILFSTIAVSFFVMLLASFWFIGRGAKELQGRNEELYRSEERFQLISKATNDTLYDWDMIQNNIWFSENMKVLYGKNIDNTKLSIDWWSGEIHHDDKKQVLDSMDKAINSKASVQTYEYRFRRADGSYASVLDRGFIVRDASGKSIRMLGSIQDITERKSAELSLQKQSAKDEAILQSIGDGLIATDETGKVQVINKTAQELLGLKDKSLLNKDIVQNVVMLEEHGKIVPNERRPIIVAMKTGKEVHGNYIYQRKDKTIFPVTITVTPVILEGKLIGAIEVFRDITKETEVDRAKTEFVSLASHQLRTPLSSINWYTEMLLNGDAGELSSEQKKYLNEVFTANQLMVELVNSLLNVSRIDLGTFMVEPEQLDIVETAKSVVIELEPQIFKQQQKVTENYAKNIPTMNMDKRLTRMIFQNLLSNAIKYTPKKGSIDLAVKVVDKDLEITVKDTGFGIPKDQQDKIFTKLFRADNVRAKDTEGTGLGLYIIKSIVDNTGGKMWFESVEDKGTTFFIRLPLSGMKKKEGSKALS